MHGTVIGVNWTPPSGDRKGRRTVQLLCKGPKRADLFEFTDKQEDGPDRHQFAEGQSVIVPVRYFAYKDDQGGARVAFGCAGGVALNGGTQGAKNGSGSGGATVRTSI